MSSHPVEALCHLLAANVVAPARRKMPTIVGSETQRKFRTPVHTPTHPLLMNIPHQNCVVSVVTHGDASPNVARRWRVLVFCDGLMLEREHGRATLNTLVVKAHPVCYVR